MEVLNRAEENLSRNLNVRILCLPPCTVAACHFIGENPEEVVGEKASRFVQESRLYERKGFFCGTAPAGSRKLPLLHAGTLLQCRFGKSQKTSSVHQFLVRQQVKLFFLGISHSNGMKTENYACMVNGIEMRYKSGESYNQPGVEALRRHAQDAATLREDGVPSWPLEPLPRCSSNHRIIHDIVSKSTAFFHFFANLLQTSVPCVSCHH